VSAAAQGAGLARVVAVHASVPGRLRLRVPVLRRSERLKAELERHLAGVPGVLRAEANPLTASVLVLHEPAVAPGLVVAAVSAMLPASAPLSASHGEDRPAPPAARLDPLGWLAGALGGLMARSAPAAEPPQPLAVAATGDDPAWHALDAQVVTERLASDPGTGLAPNVAEGRLARFGPNVLIRPPARSAASLLLEQVATAPVALLGVSAAVAVLTGGLLDAAVILGVVAANAAIGFFTEQQSEAIIAAMEDFGPRSAVVVRGGRRYAVRSDTVVPGDLIALAPGTQVPADARLIESSALTVDESALTGESLPADKDAGRVLAADTPLADRDCMVFMGTHVTGGSGTAVVVATGLRTQIGVIQALAGSARAPDTPLERQLDRMGTQLALLSGGVCAAVLGVGLLRGSGWLEMLKSSIALAVAAVPEGLPTIATTTLALGIREMRVHKVLIRHLDAVETLGSVQVFCLDKTGTLTENRMAVVCVRAGEHGFSAERDRLQLDGVPVDPASIPELGRLLEVLALCSTVELNGTPRGQELNGTPTELALLRLALGAGVQVGPLREAYPVLEVEHRSESRQFMATVHGSGHAGARLIAVKGSPAQVLDLCDRQLLAGTVQPLFPSAREALLADNDALAGRALRVLGVAYAERGPGEPTTARALTWLGLVGMTDPVRPGMEWVLGRFHRAGIGTVMITGDQSATAYAVGRRLNLGQGEPLEVLDSTHLDRLDPELLAGLTRRVRVFSRVSPAHKLQIVQALQRAGRVVAMTGDGVNDSPALKAADLGVAMGGSGSDVARSVADVILEDDNLHTMVVAVRQGRTVYGNIRKALRFLLSTNFAEIEVMLAGIALGAGQPLNAMQLLWINLVTDIFPGLALALEPWEPDIMDRPPRDPEAPIVSRGDLLRLARESGVISAGTLASYAYALARYGQGPAASTQAFTTLTLAQLLHALSCRSESHGLFQPGTLQPNRYLDLALGVSLLVQALTVLVPGLRQILGTVPIGPVDALVALAGAGLPLLVNEALKGPAGRPAERQVSHQPASGQAPAYQEV
jgi:Ca2+-transporting ATPase